ncbi:UNVERIFIED_CONTAM: hypothetical protein GTU68_047276 [Idotea baltica]|nr:hypothetical protein [Idotea baltica]
MERPLDALLNPDIDAVIIANGPETEYVLRLAQRHGATAPIIVLIDEADESIIANIKSHGAQDFLVRGQLQDALAHRILDYSIQLKTARETIQRLSNQDPLTGALNRSGFRAHLERATDRSKRYGFSTALLYVNIDQFANINDNYGEGGGDIVIQAVTRRLLNKMRSTDSIARVGPDEFAIVLEDIESEQDEIVAKRILDSLSQPIPLQTHNPVVTPSIGIAMYPHDGTDPDTLVRNADTAMYVAKAEGRACYRFYDEKMNATAVEQLKMEEELRHALQNNELELRYQPQVDVSNGKVVSMEALVRWKHPERGMVSPLQFIPVAESTGQIIELGNWVLSEVARHCSYWDTLDQQDFRICVNISPLQFNQTDLPQYIAEFLRKSGLAPDRLELEFTETAVMTDAETNIAKLRELKALGMDLAIDDFGTGYSSLSYLKRFPIDTLKIDQSFVADLNTSDGAAIVDAILALAKTLNLRVIAEGIETKEQLSYLVKRECALLQGYFFSRPIYPEDVPLMLKQNFMDFLVESSKS